MTWLPHIRSFGIAIFLAGCSGDDPVDPGPSTSGGGSSSGGSGAADASGGAPGASGGGPTQMSGGGPASGTGGEGPGAGTGGIVMGSGGGTSETGGTSGQPEARTSCPDAPPAASKAAASDRSLSVQKDAYAALIDQPAPFTGTRGTLPWHLYSPPDQGADADMSYPLLVVLHGGYGREVEDGNILVDVAPYLLGAAQGLLTEQNRTAYPTYILFPHCVEANCGFGQNEWASPGGRLYEPTAEPSISGGTALELIEHVIAEYAVDPTRVYLTGNSMGGGGTWEFAVRRPELFAAILPVSGHPPALSYLSTIADARLPVWAFGGDADNTNPYDDTVDAVDAIDNAGGCAWLTTYTGTGHDDALWSSPYLEPEIWSWLFSQTNPSAPR